MSDMHCQGALARPTLADHGCHHGRGRRRRTVAGQQSAEVRNFVRPAGEVGDVRR
jgi:hypothetical protein